MSHIAPSTGETSFRTLLWPTTTDDDATTTDAAVVCIINNCVVTATATTVAATDAIARGDAVASVTRRRQIVPNAMSLFLPRSNASTLTLGESFMTQTAVHQSHKLANIVFGRAGRHQKLRAN
jgi:hypothetical protein